MLTGKLQYPDILISIDGTFSDHKVRLYAFREVRDLLFGLYPNSLDHLYYLFTSVSVFVLFFFRIFSNLRNIRRCII